MRKQIVWICALVTLVCSGMSVARGQTSVDIPLRYVFDSQSNAARLAIYVGINNGTPQPYLFDTGSALFNAAYNPATWNNLLGPSVPLSNVPNGNGVQVCYSGGAPCRGYTGNIIQVPSLDFYPNASPGALPVATLSARSGPGFQMNAVYSYTDTSGNNNINDSFPSYFNDPTAPPPQEGLFYGVFGSRISVDQLNKSPSDPTCVAPNCYIAGGILGQTVMPNAFRQGFVVAANGQLNPPVSTDPNRTDTKVRIGGVSQDVTSCNPCVTVGLTEEIIGQFATAKPTTTSAPGLVQWVQGSTTFPNPYGDGTIPNNAAPTNATYFTVTLAGVTDTQISLLDTGTKLYALSSSYPVQENSGTIKITGATPSQGSIPGAPTTSGSLSGPPNYYATGGAGEGSTNTIGLPFFTLNSVLFDLTDMATGYSPFFVTAAKLATTAGGPLIVDYKNVPLGLAGVISGPGGVTIDSGGAVQLSAVNTYTGETRIAGASGGNDSGLMFISGKGSIAASKGVMNDGVLDISRAWEPVSIKTLSGSGWVNLGGQTLVITDGSSTFSGDIGDEAKDRTNYGSYGTGGRLIIAGGRQTLAGTINNTGGTVVTGGTLDLTGTLDGALTVMAGGTFNNSGIVDALGLFGVLNEGVATNRGTMTTDVFNFGSFTNDGTITGTAANFGILSGTGTLNGALFNLGIVAPGSSGSPYGTMKVSGPYAQASTALFQVSVSPSGQTSRLDVTGPTGTAALGGSVLAQVQPNGGYAPRTTYTILRASGGVSGSFSNALSSSPFLIPTLSYDANNVYLTLQVGDFQSAAQSPQQQTIANVLDITAPNATGDYASVLGMLATLTPTQVQSILTTLAGTSYSGFSSTMVQGAQFFMNNFASQAGGGGSPGSTRVALAEACDVACDASGSSRWGAWGGAIGGLGTIGAGTPQGALTYNAGGFAAGLDRAFSDTFRAGITVGTSAGTQWVSGVSGQGNTATVQAGLYGNYADGPIYADALIGYAYSNNRMTRQILIPGLAARTAWGQTGANQFYGQLETGYRFDIGSRADAFVTPFARLQAFTGTQDGFTETGAQSLNLTVAQQTTNSLRSVLGAQVGASMDMGWRDKLAMQFRLGWSHEYADVGRPVTAALAGAPATPFTTFGISPVRDGVLLGLSGSTAVAEATSVYLRYEGTLAGQDGSHALTAGVRMTW